ncbi:MAG: DUF3800 domain-containing protein [Patescibacteria group bacterium]
MTIITKLWADESGDSGFKFTSGSSRYLVIAIVYTYSEVATRTITAAISDLKRSLGLTGDYEFKFSRCSNKFKESFLLLVTSLDWQYKVIIIDKKNLHAPALVNHPQQLYCEAVRRLLYDNNPPLKKAVLTMDEAIAKIHHREFNSVLRQYVSRNLVKKVRQVRSSSDEMIQLADMVSGSIFRQYEKGSSIYSNMLTAKEKARIDF